MQSMICDIHEVILNDLIDLSGLYESADLLHIMEFCELRGRKRNANKKREYIECVLFFYFNNYNLVIFVHNIVYRVFFYVNSGTFCRD